MIIYNDENRVLKLREKYGNWGEYDKYPRCDWQYEVANGDTNRGYWEYVEAMIDSDGE